MMKFEKCLEDGQFEIHRSLNHSDPGVVAEIIVDHDLGSFEAVITDPGDDSQIDFVGRFETFDQARRHLECQVSMSVKMEELV